MKYHVSPVFIIDEVSTMVMCIVTIFLCMTVCATNRLNKKHYVHDVSISWNTSSKWSDLPCASLNDEHL